MMTKIFSVSLNLMRKTMRLRLKTHHNLFPVFSEYVNQNVLILQGPEFMLNQFVIISLYFIMCVNSGLSGLH
jgi:hypothetical protein